jgi:hypothetical protein
VYYCEFLHYNWRKQEFLEVILQLAVVLFPLLVQQISLNLSEKVHSQVV